MMVCDRDVSGRHKRVVVWVPSQENASLSCHNLQDSSRIIESKPGSRCKGPQRRMAMPKKETRITTINIGFLLTSDHQALQTRATMHLYHWTFNHLNSKLMLSMSWLTYFIGSTR